MSERYMPSIFTDCDDLKQVYDKCFTSFFQQYINSDFRHKNAYNPCERLHIAYRDCVEKRLEQNRPFEIDLEELRKQTLNTENDRFNTTN